MKADGTLPEGDKKILRDLADWMVVNREAIHGAKVWRKSSEYLTKMQEGQFSDQKEMVYTPQDYRFTVNHGNIYAIALKCPQDGNFAFSLWQKAVTRISRNSMGLSDR